MGKYLKQSLLMVLLSAWFIPSSVYGAQFRFEPEKLSVPQASPFTVTLTVNSEEQSLNAVDGTLLIAEEFGDNITVTDSGSVVTYWVTRPEWDAKTRSVKFSGALPGGYEGKAGILFSVIIPTYKGNHLEQALSLVDAHSYLNDGLGTPAKIAVKSFSIGEGSSSVDPEIQSQLFVDESKPDNIPPEIFSPQVAQDERVYDGNWFINFATTDKQSGIDHYEVQESQDGRIDSGKWKTATSPYLLEDQDLHSFIFVLAIDRQGNERIIKVFPRNPLNWVSRNSSGLAVAGLLLMVIIGASVYTKYRQPALDNTTQNKL